MEKIIQRGTDHRFLVKKIGDDRYEVTFQEFSKIANTWYTLSREMYDESGLSML